MRRDAKALPAASTQPRVARRRSTACGDLTLSSLAAGNRIVALSSVRRLRLGVLAVAAALLLLAIVVSSAAASDEVATYFGNASGSGSLGGQFNNPRGIAVNASGNGPANPGDTYVADDSNNRVERFDSSGNFVSAWGADVIQSGKPGDIAGVNPFEVCTVAADCQAGAASGGNGETSGDGALNSPQSVAVDGDTGNVYVSDRKNFRIDEYSGTGAFIASFGFDVDATTAPTGYEVCPAADVCKVGLAGAGTGQVGSAESAETLGVAVSSPDGNVATGTVFLADTRNRRVNTYSLDGGSPSSFGSSATFESGEPRKIAVDSRGILYASDTSGGGVIQRYDTQNANGGGTVFLAPIPTPGNEVQTIHFSGFASLDRYTLTCPDGTTSEPVPYLENIQGSLNPSTALESCGGQGNFQSTGIPPATTVTYKGPQHDGPYAGTNVPPMICTAVPPSTGTCTVTTDVDGFSSPLPIGRTLGLAVGPDTDGAGPSKDRLYVLRHPRDPDFQDKEIPPTVIEQFGPDNQPGLVAPPGAVDDIHGSSANFSFPNDVGFDEASGKLFVSSTEELSEIGSGHRVYVLADPSSVPPPSLTIDPVTAKTDTTATFTGTIDPEGFLVKCYFEYSLDQSSWSYLKTAAGTPLNFCGSISARGGTQPVSENVTVLDPNSHYFVRLAAFRPFVPNPTTARTNVTPFDTDSVPPLVSDVGAVEVADTSARLVGTIDPRHSATGYVFEYGPTPALGSSTAPLDIGAGTSPITISRVIEGLSPDTTYYFKLVASNAFGTVPSPETALHTRTEPFPLPEHRAYEQVTPPDKNFGDADRAVAANPVTAVSLDGNATAFCTQALFGEPAGRMTSTCAPYVSRRTPTGWQTSSPFPQYCHVDPISGSEDGTMFPYPSADFSRFVLRISEFAGCSTPPLSPAAPLQAGAPSNNLYAEDSTAGSTSYHLLSPEDGGPLGYAPVGGSDDFSHVVYATDRNQTPPPDSPASGVDFRRLYDWEAPGQRGCAQTEGCLSFIAKDEHNEPFSTPSDIPEAVSTGGNNVYLTSAVSDDGERIFFQNPVPASETFPGIGCTEAQSGCELYLRDEGATTYNVSSSECTVACGSGSERADDLISATPSGNQAFFTSCAKLTDESAPDFACNEGPWPSSVGSRGSKLYRWDLASPPGHHLVDLTADHEPSDGSQPDFLGLIGESDDGNTAYFVTRGQIVSGAPTTPTVANGLFSEVPFENAKLYRWRWNGGSPVVNYIGLYDGLTSLSSQRDINWSQLRRTVSPDGKDLLIYTKRAIDPAVDRDSDADAYRWDDVEGWSCVSCQLPGVPSAGDVDRNESRLAFGFSGGISPLHGVGSEPGYFLSNDGKHIVFATPDALVPQDVNGNAGCPSVSLSGLNKIPVCTDVYEWDDGTVSLISSGTGDQPVQLVGSTPSGKDIFFLTRQALVGWDRDQNTDIYDARVGGGFPEPAAQPPSCEGESCRGAGSVVPAATGAGTAVFQGPADPTPKHGKATRRHHKKRHHQHRHRRPANHHRRTGR